MFISYLFVITLTIVSNPLKTRGRETYVMENSNQISLIWITRKMRITVILEYENLIIFMLLQKQRQPI